MYRFCTVFCLFVLGIAASAASADQLYRIYNVPAEDRGVSCSDRADEYAATLGEQAGVQVMGALCEYDATTESRRILIRYAGEDAVRSVSTYTFHATYADKGNYATEEACLAALSWEENLFRAQTGLEIFVSFCSRQRRERDRPWYAHIEGLGEAERWPSRSTWNTNAPYGVTEDEIQADMAAYFAERDIDLVHLTMRPSATLGDATLYYYAGQDQLRVRLSGRDVGTVPGLDACYAELARLQRSIEDLGRFEWITGYCSSRYSNPTRFDLTVVHAGMAWLDRQESERGFESMEACRAAQPAIESNMRVIYGSRLVGVLCGVPMYSTVRTETPYKVIGLTTLR